MRVLFLAPEVVPFSKTGGLADVCGALPAALARLGHEVLVVTPLYGSVRSEKITSLDRTLTLRFPFGDVHAGLHEARMSPLHRVVFVSNGPFFGRPGLYGDSRGEYPDNHRRFAFFSMAGLSAAQAIGFEPDVVHLNDWPTGLAAVALARGYLGTSLERARSVFTIHNLAYQGVFPKAAMRELGLPWDLFTLSGLEFYDQLSFLKAGLSYSRLLTTVSRRYSEEIQTPDAGWGLDALLRHRSADLHGILNGVDTEEWNPANDAFLPATFDAGDLSGKERCKVALAEHFGMSLAPGESGRSPPMFGLVSRLATQKGFDLLIPALETLLRHDVRVVALGSGDARIADALGAVSGRHPGRFRFQYGYDNALSHLIEAGSDFFLMPSQYEPCGLNQMYSLIYGAVPVVRAVGGLDDTVTDLDAPEGGTGIKFGPYTIPALEEAFERALALHADPPRYREVQRRGMGGDFSWDQSARRYVEVYRSSAEL